MAQKERTKEFWLIPKRGSLHQTICLIDGIMERKYDSTTWNPQKQNNLGVNLKNWGATRDGKNVSPQSIRTLTAALPQYLGFVYINTNKTPNTICITNAGRKLLDFHKPNLIKVKNLIDGKDHIITESPIILNQMEKLQITNPIILKDCENILVFPFRFTLKLLLELNYLDREEIAYFLFNVKDESELNLKIQEIKNFRTLKQIDRKNIINAFKQTQLGNISLVQAPSASYYENICKTTGIIETSRIKPNNLDSSLNMIKIKDSCIENVREILLKYKDIPTFDFGNNLDLWIDYIGNPERLYPPIEVNIENKTPVNFLIQIVNSNKKILFTDLVYSKSTYSCPLFVGEKYKVMCLNIEDGRIVINTEIIPNHQKRNFNLDLKTHVLPQKEETIDELIYTIKEHSSSVNFPPHFMNYLKVLQKSLGINKTDDKSLRGAYYEFLFYKLLTLLKNKGIIDDVYWNGKIGKYGLPVQAPGGKTGTPDIIFKIDDFDFVLELTTIKAKSLQFQAEIASVPDHIRLYKGSISEKRKVIGIFCAPIIHDRNTNTMQTILQQYCLKLHCLTDTEFLNILNLPTKKDVLEILLKGLSY